MALIIDLVGLTLTSAEEQLLTKPVVAGVILFSRNYQNQSQLKKLTQAITSINPKLLICTDHEGGKVQRFKQGFTQLPAMAKLGKIFSNNEHKAQDLATAIGYVLAYELQTVGVDFSFTPVADIDYGHNTVIGDRAFSNKARAVINLASAIIDGMHQAGMACVIKHFPGHGFVNLDSHITLPIDKREMAQINKDLSVFKALLPKADALMPAHIIYKKYDSSPAGFSPFWLTNILRKKLHYKGLIISDDLNMQAAVNFCPDITDRISIALNAGCDLALVCNNFRQIEDKRWLVSNKTNNLKPKPKLDKIVYENYLTKIQTIL